MVHQKMLKHETRFDTQVKAGIFPATTPFGGGTTGNIKFTLQIGSSWKLPCVLQLHYVFGFRIQGRNSTLSAVLPLGKKLYIFGYYMLVVGTDPLTLHGVFWGVWFYPRRWDFFVCHTKKMRINRPSMVFPTLIDAKVIDKTRQIRIHIISDHLMSFHVISRDKYMHILHI